MSNPKDNKDTELNEDQLDGASGGKQINKEIGDALKSEDLDKIAGGAGTLSKSSDGDKVAFSKNKDDARSSRDV
jgi:hypothetical protein